MTFNYNQDPRWGGYTYRNNRQSETLGGIKQQHGLVWCNTGVTETESRVTSEKRQWWFRWLKKRYEKNGNGLFYIFKAAKMAPSENSETLYYTLKIEI